jgi:hypothetical protein
MSFADRALRRLSKASSSSAKVLLKRPTSMSSALGGLDLRDVIGVCRVLARSKRIYG